MSSSSPYEIIAELFHEGHLVALTLTTEERDPGALLGRGEEVAEKVGRTYADDSSAEYLRAQPGRVAYAWNLAATEETASLLRTLQNLGATPVVARASFEAEEELLRTLGFQAYATGLYVRAFSV
jgi:hypothetical protein